MDVLSNERPSSEEEQLERLIEDLSRHTAHSARYDQSQELNSLIIVLDRVFRQLATFALPPRSFDPLDLLPSFVARPIRAWRQRSHYAKALQRSAREKDPEHAVAMALHALIRDEETLMRARALVHQLKNHATKDLLNHWETEDLLEQTASWKVTKEAFGEDVPPSLAS